MNKINPQICLIYGLQGTGKTTVSYKLFQLLKKKGVKKIKVVDGDDFRKKIKNFKYDSKSRELVGKKKYKYILNYYKKKYLIITSSVTGKPFINIKKPKINILKILLSCSNKIRFKRLLKTKKSFLISLKKKTIFKKNYDLKVNTSIYSPAETVRKIVKII